MVREKKSKKSLKHVLQLNHALYKVLVLYINYRKKEYMVLKIYPFFSAESEPFATERRVSST